MCYHLQRVLRPTLVMCKRSNLNKSQPMWAPESTPAAWRPSPIQFDKLLVTPLKGTLHNQWIQMVPGSPSCSILSGFWQIEVVNLQPMSMTNLTYSIICIINMPHYTWHRRKNLSRPFACAPFLLWTSSAWQATPKRSLLGMSPLYCCCRCSSLSHNCSCRRSFRNATAAPTFCSSSVLFVCFSNYSICHSRICSRVVVW